MYVEEFLIEAFVTYFDTFIVGRQLPAYVALAIASQSTGN
jgi:hypothetical protein